MRKLLLLALISPAALFMAALVIRSLPQPEIAAGAQRIVMWYSARMWTLWVLLLALPFTVLAAGCAGLFSNRTQTPAQHALTVSAAGILAVVILHMLAN